MSRPITQIDPDALQPGQPAWRIALLYPLQGSWTENDYLALDAGRLIEFDQGCVEVLEVPTKEHQRIVQFLYRVLFAFVQAKHLGEVFVAPLPVRLWEGKFREPDVIFVGSGRAEYQGYPDGADIVMEVLSDDASSRRRDAETKWREYAQAGISEYWVVDPASSKVVLGNLRDGRYDLRELSHDDMVQSMHLPGFELHVSEILASALIQPE